MATSTFTQLLSFEASSELYVVHCRKYRGTRFSLRHFRLGQFFVFVLFFGIVPTAYDAYKVKEDLVS